MAMKNTDLLALRDYVTHDTGILNKAETTVLLNVTHSNLKAMFMELRFDLHMTIMRVKEKLMTHCGSNISAMNLKLKDWDGKIVADMSDDSRVLGYYSPLDQYTIHIADSDVHSASANGWLEDVSKVQKYEMSDDAYNARGDTYRKYKERMVAQDPSWTIEKEMAARRKQEYVPPKEPTTDPDFMAKEAEGMAAGQRCEVQPGGKRGEIKWVGQSKAGLPLGWWVGVHYDEPVGKNDGSVKGVRFFTCPDGYGGLVRPDKVTVGDYPPIDEFEDLDEI